MPRRTSKNKPFQFAWVESVRDSDQTPPENVQIFAYSTGLPVPDSITLPRRTERVHWGKQNPMIMNPTHSTKNTASPRPPRPIQRNTFPD